MFQTWDNSQLLRRVLWISAELTIVSSLKYKNTQPLYIFNRERVLHLDRLKEGTWLHSFDDNWLIWPKNYKFILILWVLLFEKKNLDQTNIINFIQFLFTGNPMKTSTYISWDSIKIPIRGGSTHHITLSQQDFNITMALLFSLKCTWEPTESFLVCILIFVTNLSRIITRQSTLQEDRQHLHNSDFRFQIFIYFWNQISEEWPELFRIFG